MWKNRCSTGPVQCSYGAVDVVDVVVQVVVVVDTAVVVDVISDEVVDGNVDGGCNERVRVAQPAIANNDKSTARFIMTIRRRRR